MKSKIKKSVIPFGARVFLAMLLLVATFSLIGSGVLHAENSETKQAGKMLTVYDRGTEKIILSQQSTIGEALKEAGIFIDEKDVVEPSLDEKMVASDYRVNIYRARPVLIIDGNTRLKITTAYQTVEQIVESAGLTIYDEDEASISSIKEVTFDGAGLEVNIHRANFIDLTLYGKTIQARTFAKTVSQFLREKNIELDSDDNISASLNDELVPNQELRIWREGKQVTTIDEAIPFEVEKIEDADREISYREVKEPGQVGSRQVSYEISMEDGVEVGRLEIASLITKQPKRQLEVVGIKGRYTTPSENESITWDYLIDHGFSRVQAAGIMGNLMQEHRFRTDGDGLAQWIGSRRANLYSRSEPNNIYTQLDFMMHELDTGYAYVRNAIKSSDSLGEVVRLFQDQFERCNPSYCMYNQRLVYARDILASH